MGEALKTGTQAAPDQEPLRMHRWWSWATAFCTLAAVSFPLAIFYSAQLTDKARLRQEATASTNARLVEQDRLRLEYIRVAIAILEPTKPTEPQKELRRWAVEVLNKSAEVKLSDVQSQTLIDGTSALPKFGTDYGYGNGYGIDYGYYFGDPCGPETSPAPTQAR